MEEGANDALTPDAEAEAAWRRAAAAERSAYGRFCEKLRHPSAKPLVHRMHQFVTEFAVGRPNLEAADEVHRFQDRASAWMLSKAVAFAADADEEGTREANEGLEKFLLCRLYPKVFAADPADKEADATLYKHISGLSWIEPKHLGIPPVELALFPVAIRELRSIDEYRAPKDKLLCILNACNVINDILKATHETAGDGKVRALSADDFLPLLIYLVVRANPAHLHSNAEFVAAFRHPSRLSGEDAYFATAFCSAKEFLASCGPSSFEVSLEEYTIQYAAAVAKAEVPPEAPAEAAAEAPAEAPPEAASEGAETSESAGASSSSVPPRHAAAKDHDADGDEDRERMLFSVREANVFQIPPAASAAGHKADHWQKAICKGPLRVVGAGAKLLVRLFDSSSGNLFAQCDIPVGEHDKFVEPVVDSSRYFVLKITNGQRHAFVGIGFDDRNDSFDFKCALAESARGSRSSVGGRSSAPLQPRDLSLKDGDKITINLKTSGSRRPQAAQAASASQAILAPPRPAVAPLVAQSGGASASAAAPSGPWASAARPMASPSDDAQARAPGHWDADADPFDDFVSAVPIRPSDACGSSPSVPALAEGGGNDWGDFGGFQASEQQAPPSRGQPLRPEGLPARAPAEAPESSPETSPDGSPLDGPSSASDPLNEELVPAASPPQRPDFGNAVEHRAAPPTEDPFAEFCSLGKDHDHLREKAVPCR